MSNTVAKRRGAGWEVPLGVYIEGVGASLGISASASFTPAAAAYSANDIMDVAKELAWTFDGSGLAIPAGSQIRILTAVLKIDQTALQASEAAYALQNFSLTPPTALNDNDAFTLASANLPAYRGAMGLGTPVDLGSACYVEVSEINKNIRLDPASSSTWAWLQTLAGFTATAVIRQVFLRGTLV